MIKNFLSRCVKWPICSIFYRFTNSSNNLIVGKNTVLKNVNFGLFNVVSDNAVLKNASLGDFSYVAHGAKLNNVKIGKFCSIGFEVVVGGGSHPVRKFTSTHPIFYSPSSINSIRFVDRSLFSEFTDVVIGSDVWIGCRAIILDGVQVGDGAIIGAGAVVTSDVEPYSIVSGSPAINIGSRFDPKVVEYLLSRRWWDDDWRAMRSNAEKYRTIHQQT